VKYSERKGLDPRSFAAEPCATPKQVHGKALVTHHGKVVVKTPRFELARSGCFTTRLTVGWLFSLYVDSSDPNQSLFVRRALGDVLILK
jgi:hypothetical protein